MDATQCMMFFIRKEKKPKTIPLSVAVKNIGLGALGLILALGLNSYIIFDK